MKVPWAEDRSRFTLLFERFAIDVLHESATILGACRLLGIGWDACWGIMERAVRRGQSRKQDEIIPVLCVDEKAVRKGHDYVTLVCDYAASTIAHVEDPHRRARHISFESDWWYADDLARHCFGIESLGDVFQRELGRRVYVPRVDGDGQGLASWLERIGSGSG